jgi:hypothetical protein
MQQAGEGEETGALTGASAPEIPNPKHQAPRKSQVPNSQKGVGHVGLFWLLRFEFSLGFGFWDLGFPA